MFMVLCVCGMCGVCAYMYVYGVCVVYVLCLHTCGHVWKYEAVFPGILSTFVF